MKVIALEKTKLTLPDLAALAKPGTVILTHNGKPLAAVNDLSQSDWESVSLTKNRRFRALIEESRCSYRKKGGITLQEIRSKFGLKSRNQRRKQKTRSSGMTTEAHLA